MPDSPHHPASATSFQTESNRAYFITWRTHGSLPESLKNKYGNIADFSVLKHGDSTAKYARLLVSMDEDLGKHSNNGLNISIAPFADIITEAILFHADTLYDLYAYCIMPNHVHVLLMPLVQANGLVVEVRDIVKRLKGFISFRIRRTLVAETPVWASGFYARCIRGTEDLENVIQYILNNPVKAGLVSRQSDWRYSYFNEAIRW